MSDFVSCIIVGEVGAVSHEALSFRSEKVLYAVSCDGKKGSYDIVSDRRNTCKTFQCRASDKVKDYCFEVIVRIVGGCNFFPD